MSEESTPIRKLYREPLFDHALEGLRSQGGYGAIASSKADEFIGGLLGRTGGRDRFRFTRKGEHRIRYCRKVDLGCGYRVVCIQKGDRLVLLTIGTHDDCFRWIERHRTGEYDFDAVPADAWMPARDASAQPDREKPADSGEDRFAEAYEKAIMERIDDAVLRRVFSGLTGWGPERA
jgi:hypothetical protein